MTRYFNLAMLVLVSANSVAGGIDVYGTDQKIAANLLQMYGQAIFMSEQSCWSLRLKQQMTSEKESFCHQQQLNFIQKIKEKWPYQTVLIETVYYPDTKDIFTTISLDKAPTYQAKMRAYQAKEPADVLDKLLTFIPKAVQFSIQHPEYANALNCLDYHCITPEHPYFKHDLNYFRHEVPLQLPMILSELKSSSTLERRRAAIFALGFLKDPEEIAKILEENLVDASSLIRHDCLRVYGELLQKAPMVKVNLDVILPGLYSVYVAERNKTLIILNELVKQRHYRMQISENTKQQLLLLRQLRQPNNHELANQILTILDKA